jgi:hypothetical protein
MSVTDTLEVVDSHNRDLRIQEDLGIHRELKLGYNPPSVVVDNIAELA